MTSCLVAGQRGMLASALTACARESAFASQLDIHGRDLPELDITSPDSVRAAFDEIRPGMVVNCAAWTDVDGAESHPREAFYVNAAGPEILARACRRSGALLVHIGTDFVFDGRLRRPYREADEPNPLSAYARTKLLGERAVAQVAPEHLIVRTAWLYGPGGKNFVDTILQLAREKGKLRVVDDQRGSPTFTGVLSRLIWQLLERGARGLYHVAGSGSATWYDLASAAVETAGLECFVEPVSSEEFPRPARRPPNSALDCTKAEELLEESIPHWKMGLRAYLAPDGSPWALTGVQ